jgi:hypothetical protein
VPRRGIVAALAVLCGLAAASGALARAGQARWAHTAQSNGVSASLTPAVTPGLTLTITRNGQIAYRQPVRVSGCPRCAVTAVPPGKQSLHVLDLESDGQPDVVLGFFSGGADCCFIDQVLSLDPQTSTYVKSQHDFLDAGAALEHLDRHWVFMSGDSRITEAGFTDTADSGTPIQIWRFSGRMFVDVTRRYPQLILADATKWRRLFNRHLSNGVGLIAAWAADEDLLGRSATVDSTLTSLAAEGKLREPRGWIASSGMKFVTRLQKLLHKLGYTT